MHVHLFISQMHTILSFIPFIQVCKKQPPLPEMPANPVPKNLQLNDIDIIPYKTITSKPVKHSPIKNSHSAP